MVFKVILFLFLLQLIKSNEAGEFRGKLPEKSDLKLVIDHDGGADDAMAIFMCLLYEQYFYGPQVIGLTTTHGNVNESQVFVNSQRILDIAGRREVPIYRGSTRSLVIEVESDFYFGYDGLGDSENVTFEAIRAEKEHAVFALVELSKKFAGKLVVMAIGSMTNIAMAIRLDPAFISRLSQLYVGAGHIYNDRNKSPEFNAEMDVEAYRIITDSATPDKVTAVPFSQVQISLNNSNEWRKEVLGKIHTPIMRAQNSFEQISLPASNSWKLLDPAVAAVVLDENVVEDVKLTNNSIILCGGKRGINTNDFQSSEPNVRMIYSENNEYYKQLLVNIFSAQTKC